MDKTVEGVWFLKIKLLTGKEFLDIFVPGFFYAFIHGKCIHGSSGDALKCQSVIAKIKIQSLDFRRAEHPSVQSSCMDHPDMCSMQM